MIGTRHGSLIAGHRSLFTDDRLLITGMNPSRHQPLATLAAVLLLAWQTPLLADVLVGTNGKQLVGKVLEETADTVVFEPEIGGKLTIPRDRIREIQRTPPAESPLTNQLSTINHQLSTNPVPSTLATNQLSTINSQPSTNQSPSWFTLPESGDQFDWIQLKHGEWLKGRLTGMQNHKLEFDSEEFGEQTFDWKDIQRLWAPKFNQVAFEKQGAVVGSLLITRDQVQVAGEQTNTYPRSELVSIAPGGRSEWDNWSAKLALGLNFRAGNTKQVDYNAHIAIARLTPSSRLKLDYLGNYSELDGVESANNQRITTGFDYFLSKRLYLQLPLVEYYKDPLQNLSYRLTLGGGVGYDLISTARTRWTVTLGPAYQINQYDSVEAGQESHKEAFATVLGSRIDIELTKRIDLILEYRGQLTSKEVGETTHHSIATLSVDLTRRLDLDVSFVWDRISSPKTDASGITPLKDDFRLTLGLGIKF